MGCVGGSFSAVTLALLETLIEEIPPFIPDILLGSGLGPPRLLQSSWAPTSSSHHRRSCIPLPCASLLPLQVSLIIFRISK